MRPIQTAAEMRAAEERTIAAGTAVQLLMDRAGLGVAEAVRRYAGPMPALVLCGPGNNGGDGYVAARYLRERGVDVRVAALGEPKPGAAADAAGAWEGPVESVYDATPAPLLIDALFGTGLTRGLQPELAARLHDLCAQARVRVAVDLPSGVQTDTGAVLSPVPDFDLTVTFAPLKPAHLLQPAAANCGRVVTVDIGVDAGSSLSSLGRPMLRKPGPDDHKYTRGYVAVVAGEMPGAAALAATAALGAGAGYVRLIAPEPLRVAHAIVQSRDPEVLVADPRIGAVVVGPGLGRSETARRLLQSALSAGRPMVLDGDALHLVSGGLAGHILTPHEGEFRAMFPRLGQPSKVERARAASAETGAVVVYKGADTVIAAPDGQAVIAAEGSSWLSTAGTGDVLAGAIGAMLSRGLTPFEAAQAGVWLHGAAAGRLGAAFTADDLARALSSML